MNSPAIAFLAACLVAATTAPAAAARSTTSTPHPVDYRTIRQPESRAQGHYGSFYGAPSQHYRAPYGYHSPPRRYVPPPPPWGYMAPPRFYYEDRGRWGDRRAYPRYRNHHWNDHHHHDGCGCQRY